jgi:pimeloyl-ACP methyl ester carboxylesterase
VYEPPLGLEAFPGQFVAHLESLVSAAQRDAAVELMVVHIVGLPDEAVAALRADPDAWQPMHDSVHTLPRELRTVEGLEFDAGRYRNVNVPVLLLSGDESPPELRTGVQRLHDVLDQAHLVTMSGVGHEAVSLRPDTFTETLITELTCAR